MTILHLIQNQPKPNRDGRIAELEEALHTEKLLHMDTKMKLLAIIEAIKTSSAYHATILDMIARDYADRDTPPGA